MASDRQFSFAELIQSAVQHHAAGQLSQAEQLYRQVLAVNPYHAQANHLLGLIAYQMGQNDSAIKLMRKAIETDPDYGDAYNNLGLALHISGRTRDAAKCYHNAISLQPESCETRNNLGIAHHDDGQLEDAVTSYKVALALRPDYPEAHYNLGNTFKYQGRYDHARKQYNRFLSAISVERQTLPPTSESMEEVVALIPFGRAGSMFLHSLFDGHPEVTTLPGVYFKGFFGHAVWPLLNRQPGHTHWREQLVERFADEYAVLFDAHIEKPVFGNPFGDTAAIGTNSGFTSMGEDRRQSLKLDRHRFTEILMGLLGAYDTINPGNFFKLLHIAYDQTLERTIAEKQIFYHIHNPSPDELGRFIAAFPRARLLIIVREPVQALESWIHLFLEDPKALRQAHHQNNDAHYHANIERIYRRIAMVIVSMLDQMDDLAFCRVPAVGIRLEDIKQTPKTIMPRLAQWMGITNHPSLYESTFQGNSYWGPPSRLNPNLRGFDATNIKRKIGVVFSERDSRIFGTLLYPLAVRFGYRKANANAFRQELASVRKFLDEPLDFERNWVQVASDSRWLPQDFTPFRLLRNRLLKAWRLLDAHDTIPFLPEPLDT